MTSSLGSVVKCENSLSLSLSLSLSHVQEELSGRVSTTAEIVKILLRKKIIIILGEDEFDFIDYSQTHTE